jgi:hypothetical protein
VALRWALRARVHPSKLKYVEINIQPRRKMGDDFTDGLPVEGAEFRADRGEEP